MEVGVVFNVNTWLQLLVNHAYTCISLQEKKEKKSNIKTRAMDSFFFFLTHQMKDLHYECVYNLG